MVSEWAIIVAGVVWLHVFLKSLGEVAILSYSAPPDLPSARAVPP